MGKRKIENQIVKKITEPGMYILMKINNSYKDYILNKLSADYPDYMVEFIYYSEFKEES